MALLCHRTPLVSSAAPGALRWSTILMPNRLMSLQRRYSVVKVESSDMYERGRPKVGGLNDLALGTMDRQERCTTDSANAQAHL